MKASTKFVSLVGLFFALVSTGPALQNPDSPNAEGYLTVAGEKVQLRHAYAWAQPGFFDESKEDIVVIVSNLPLSDQAVEDEWERNEMVREGTLKFVQVTINSEHQPISTSVKHSAFQASPSGFSSDYALDLKAFSEENLEGRFYCKTEQDFFDTLFTFDFTFKAGIRRKQELPPPTEAEKEEAAKSPQAAVYLEFVRALHAGDVQALKEVLAADVAGELDGPDQADMLEFLQLVTPSKAEFQRLAVEGDSATLTLSAQDEGVELKGTIEFLREGDHWKVQLSDWEEK